MLSPMIDEPGRLASSLSARLSASYTASAWPLSNSAERPGTLATETTLTELAIPAFFSSCAVSVPGVSVGALVTTVLPFRSLIVFSPGAPSMTRGAWVPVFTTFTTGSPLALAWVAVEVSADAWMLPDSSAAGVSGGATVVMSVTSSPFAFVGRRPPRAG